MFRKILSLEWKAFTRSASFATNLAIKILLGLGALYVIGIAVFVGIGAYYAPREFGMEPLSTINRFLLYFFISDLILRLMLQKIPVLNIKPLLALPISKPTIVNFVLGKTYFSFFNIYGFFLFIPLTVVLFIEGHNPIGIVAWFVSMVALIYINNFLNLLLNNKDNLFYFFLLITAALAAAQYYEWFDVTLYTVNFYYGLYNHPWMVVIPLLLVTGLYLLTFRFFMANLYLDAGLAKKHTVAKTEHMNWLDKFGKLGTFLKNDIRMIRRNKRSKSTVIMSIVFLFYGFLFFTDAIEVYNNPWMHMFAGIFVSGGFLFTFGQFVPSWDSSYYPLLMTQNIPYREYLSAKWWLIVIATAASTILASFYIVFGMHIYLMIVVGAIYNIGVNSYLVLLGGAYTKTPIDLSTTKGAFGDKKAFNAKTLLLSLPKLLLPMVLYALGKILHSPEAGLVAVALAGVLGFAMKNIMFGYIEKVYKIEKYSTLDAYKQKS
jgi:hypothetical protein